MSERKKFILKNHPIQNKFSCPNTSSSPYGGIEGRRSLSTLSIKTDKKDLEKKSKNNFKKPQPSKVRLTGRDKLIIDLLQKQDFCFYSDIKKKFFSSDASACNRLSKLKKKGYIKIEPLDFSRLRRDIDASSIGLIGRNLKIIRLSNKSHFVTRHPSTWKKTHQLLLFSVKERLEDLLQTEAIFENQIRDLKETLYTGKYQPLPDFYLKGEDFKLAVELELHLKTQGRYFLKMAEYSKSSFTHVLYVTTYLKKMNRLIKTFRYKRYIAISHYANVEEVISHRYGKLPLSEWLKRRTK
ncbi:MAG: hypothetical protein OXB86_03860 [Bdellovibrionales bacterium]|nr:hypothetical protein [Bdellovibrionales bacterium]